MFTEVILYATVVGDPNEEVTVAGTVARRCSKERAQSPTGAAALLGSHPLRLPRWEGKAVQAARHASGSDPTTRNRRGPEPALQLIACCRRSGMERNGYTLPPI